MSEYLCELAVREYSKDKKLVLDSDLHLPPVDKIIDYMLGKKMNIANEVIRLYNNKEIAAEQVAKIYLGIRALEIQFNKTTLIRELVKLASDNDLIFSKNDATSPIAIEKSTGKLVNNLLKLQKEREVLKEKEEAEKRRLEKTRKEIDEWKRENPGEDPSYRYLSKEDMEFHKKLEAGKYMEVKDDNG